MDGAAEWLALIGAVGVALGVITKWVIRPLMRFHAGMARFLEDWNGRPDRPGFQGHPGAMARLAQLENNGGKSIKDLVERTAADTQETAAGLRTLTAQFAEHLEDNQRERAAGQRTERELREAISHLSEALPVVARSVPSEHDIEPPKETHHV